MQALKVALSFLGIVAVIPSVALFPIVIITAIIGAIKKDFTYLKMFLKFWAYSLVGIFAILILYAVVFFLAK